MGTNAVLSQIIPSAAGYKGSEEAEGWAGGSGGILGSLSLCLDQALPQTSPRSQGCIAVPVIKLSVPHVCNDLCRERRLARISREQGRYPWYKQSWVAFSAATLARSCPRPLSLSLLLSVTSLETFLG